MRNISEKDFEIKYDLYKDTIYRIAYTYVHNYEDAEDIMQEVFIKYLNSDEAFKSLDNEKYWLIRVTINLCKNKLSSSWNKKIVIDEIITDDVEENKDDSDTKKVYYAVTNLPIKYKEPIVLFYYEDLKIEEIAQILKKTTSCIKKRLERARQMIKKEIEENEELR